ncbi:cell wall protein RBR3-like [Pomacea canaliculata]|uniref:cell wall protein RBR3-like n=1 Tax=Pomacea canaliculata TaxID=400727 RepID=UPI000D7293D1|nr:cell wall protein RBR3-like [Pomacea canaliculata]
MNFPWDSLPKDWTTAVKLREISKRRREERNSSSGNWSGSSNRQSLDSARSSTLPSSTSQHSLGRDSGRDSPSLDDRSGTDTSTPTDKTTQDCLLSTFAPLKSFSAKDGTRDTEEWLRSLAQRAACREDATADITASLSCLSLLTRQNIQELDSMSTGLQRPPKMDDEVSSVYSLDQEGFYTSFHNDSGLRRSTNMLLEGEDDTHLNLVKEAHSSMLSIGSNNTIDSVIFRPFGASGAETAQEPDSSPVASQSHDEKSKKVRPLPPPRCGSCLSGNSSDTSSKRTSPILESAAVRVTKTSGEQSNSESDQETVCARVRSKTRISPHTFPSWCLISDEDSTDSSSSHLNRQSPQDTASVSLSGSRSHEGAGPMNPLPQTGSSVAVEPSLQGEKALETGWKAVETGWKGSTLPRLYLESKVWEEDVQEQNNSWPRSRRSQHQQPTAGILKRDKSPAGTLKPKTLNFAPVVSYFDHQTPDGSEASLASSTLSSLDSSSDQSGNYQLAMPFPSPSNGISDGLVDPKYQPTITVKPGRSGDFRIRSQIIYPPTLVKATSTPMSNHYLPGMSSGVVESSEGSVTSSQSSIPSLSDCGRGGYLDMSRSLGNPSLDTLSSSSSAAFSDIDSSLTYVSSPNITPTNSVLRLDQDLSDTPTPVNSPSLERSANRTTSFSVNGTSSCSSVFSSKSGSGSPVVLDNGPVLHSCPPPLVQIRSDCGHTETSRIVQSKSTRSFHDLGIPEQSSGGWMAEKLAIRSRTNSLTMDSGFSSPTTPTTGLVDSQQQERVKRSSPQCGTWPSSHYSQLHNPQPLMTDAILAPEAEINSGENGRYVSARKHRTSNPPTHLSLGHTHEPLEASDGTTSFMASTPRTDSYRVAMNKDLNPQKHSLQSKHHPGRSFSSSDTCASSKNPHHPPRMTKTFSCPVGNLDDAVSRADSYRLAVRNTHGVLGELATRNTSYRMATREDDPMPEPNFRMDALNSWDRMQTKGGKDIRRMGITDVDQLKCYDDGTNFSRLSMSSVTNKGFAGINSSRKKMKQEAHSLLRNDKTPSPDLKLPPKSGKSSKDKTRTQSSTYIRFDPIFEDKDDLYTSTHSLRTQSVEMLVSENGFLMSDKIVSHMPPSRLKTSGNKKPADEKAVMSILDSIKTTIKSISSKNSADKDMWRYEGGI